MLVRTGILHVPTLDESASQAVRALLAQQPAVRCVVMLEQAVGSQRNWIETTICAWCDEEELDLILTIGGCYPASGPSSGEIVPDATSAALERLLPGLSEAMRHSAQSITNLALLDRGISGIRGRTVVVNLPAGAKPATLFLAAITELLGPLHAHLNDAPSAPTMADALALDRAQEVVKPAESHPGGLDFDEFAAFLKRDAAGGETET